MAPPATEAGEGYRCHRPSQPYLVHARGPGGRQPASRVSPCLAQQDPGDGEASGLGREEACQDGPHALVCLCPTHVQGPRVEQQQDDRVPSGYREKRVTKSPTQALRGQLRGAQWMGNTLEGLWSPFWCPNPSPLPLGWPWSPGPQAAPSCHRANPRPGPGPCRAPTRLHRILQQLQLVAWQGQVLPVLRLHLHIRPCVVTAKGQPLTHCLEHRETGQGAPASSGDQ